MTGVITDMIRPIPEDYLKECEHSGRLEELQIPDHRSAIVYLPFGYDDSDRHYSVFYLIHGGGGDQHSFFSEDGTFKNMLDNMIDKGDMAPLIVVTPTFYPPGHSGQGMSHAAEAVRTSPSPETSPRRQDRRPLRSSRA